VIVVTSGESSNAIFTCRQLNCGLRLKINSNFRSYYPKAKIYLTSEDGSLEYADDETRIAYFNPGPVSIVMKNDGKEKSVYSKTLHSQEVLTVGIAAPDEMSSASDFSISIDTTRTWLYDDVYVSDTDDEGETSEINALSVSQARANAGVKDVWVYGYIIGGDLTSGKTGMSLLPPFKSQTNLVLAARSSITDKSSCISVNLPKGDIRDALNLPDHPELIGSMLWIKGDIVASYYGIPGIKNVQEYKLK